MPRTLLLTLLFVLSLPARADEDPEMRRCAALAADAERLACYDARMKAPAVPAPAAPVAPATAAPAPPPGEISPAAETPPAGVVRDPPPDGVVVPAHLEAAVDSWHKGTRVTLDNGQVWVAVDEPKYGVAAAPAGAAVTVHQSFFGTWWMKLDGVDREVKVTRLK
jgi:hypothetical protein